MRRCDERGQYMDFEQFEKLMVTSVLSPSGTGARAGEGEQDEGGPSPRSTRGSWRQLEGLLGRFFQCQ